MAILSIISSLLGLASGVGQLAQSSEYGNMPRPDYEIPESQKKALNVALNLATMRTTPSGAVQADMMEQNLNQAYNRMLEASPSSSAAMGAIGGLQANKNIAGQQQALANDQWWLQNQQGLMGQLGQMAGQEQAAWQWNEAQPYLQAMQTSKELENAGWQNIGNSVNQIAGAGDAMIEWNKLSKMWDTMGGTEKGGLDAGLAQTQNMYNTSNLNVNPDGSIDLQGNKYSNALWGQLYK